MPKVFLVVPFAPEFEEVRQIIKKAASKASNKAGVEFQVMRAFEAAAGRLGNVIDAVYDAINDADFLIVDLSLTRPNTFYELGFADALQKPVVLIADDMGILPFDVRHRRILIYDRGTSDNSLIPRLAESLIEVHKSPESFSARFDSRSQEKQRPTAFVSYSHADKVCLRRLQIHLKPLERDGLVDVWADTRIKAGEDWKVRIAAALDEAAIAVLLISADFLASDFIINDELPPLLAAAEQKGTVILPLILKPCRFEREEHLYRFQAINPPSEPLLKLNEIDQEELYVRVAERVELEIQSRTAT